MKIIVDDIEDLSNSGVYCITNNINSKKYIGSTKNKIAKRFIDHMCLLKKNKHFNEYLQRSFNKYGIDNFTFTIIEVTTKESCTEREQYYIDFYNVLDPSIGYNISKIAHTPSTTDSVKQKISNTLKAKYANGELVIDKESRVGKPSWNKGLKCPNIGETRRKLFNAIEVYNNNKVLVVTFRSVTDLIEWSESNIMPYINIHHTNKKGSILRRDKIYLSIRKNVPYKGLYFKLIQPLHSEMGVANWVNSEEG